LQGLIDLKGPKEHNQSKQSPHKEIGSHSASGRSTGFSSFGEQPDNNQGKPK
jgi:hypothetical protein